MKRGIGAATPESSMLLGKWEILAVSRAYSLSLCLAALLLPLASVGASPGENAKTPRTDLYGDPLPPGAVARLGTIRLRHANADVTFSKDGKRLISCGCDGEVRVWDAATGKLIRRTKMAPAGETPFQFCSVAIKPDCSIAAAASNDTMYLFNTATGKECGRFPINSYNCDAILGFSPDGKVLAVQQGSSQSEHSTALWNVADVRKCQEFKTLCHDKLMSIAFAPDGKRLAGITFSGDDLFLWDATTGKIIAKKKQIATLKVDVSSLAFSPDGKSLAVGSDVKNNVRLLDATTLKDKAEFKMPADIKAGSSDRLAFSPNGQLLASVYYGLPGQAEQCGILLWRTTGETKTRRLPERGRRDTRLTFSPDGKTLVCNDEMGSEIRLWDVASGRQLHHRPGHDIDVHALAVSPDGRTIASGDHEPGLRLWDAITGKPLRAMKGDDDWPHACLFSSDGKQMISAGVVGTFQVWDVATGKERRRFEIDWPDRGLVELHAVGISADGKRLAAVAWGGQRSHSAQILVWGIATGKQRHPRAYKLEERSYGEPPMPEFSQAHAAFAPEGNRVTVWLGDRVGIEELSTGCLLATLPKGIGRPMVFSPNGRLMAATLLQPKKDPSDGDERKGLSLIETASGEEVFRLEIGAFDYAAFTPDGRGIVVTNKKTLRVWDTATGQHLYRMAWPESILDAGGEAKVHSLAMLPGGRAATGMYEGDILVWDLAPLTWPVHQPRGNLGRKELDGLWSDLAGDARRAHRAIHRLTVTQAASFLAGRLEPVTMDSKRIEKLLANLDSDSFEAREAASRELTRLHYRAEPMLRQKLEEKPTLEMRRRLQAILAKPRQPPSETRRTLRAITALERIGTPEARYILEKLITGAAAPETREAKASLERLKRR